MESAANDTVIVDIRTPNEAGLSHNQYQDLQVGNSGIIFNNSRDITPTQLAGYITGNPNIGRTGADVILNEVTGRNITNLNGFIEVAGKQADVVIANPNGIVGNNSAISTPAAPYSPAGIRKSTLPGGWPALW